MDTSPLVPNDPRVKYVKTTLRGKTYRYLLGEPEGTPIDTIFLIHGFPDMAYGWRCQIPMLMSLGLRVVAPDMIGFAGTDAPEALEEYAMKSIATDMSELIKQIVGEGNQIILGGHDWGGFAVYRIILWFPELIKAVFSVCTPYMPPRDTYFPLEAIVAKLLPQFKYQLDFAGPEVEKRIQGPEMVRAFLNTLWGGRLPDGQLAFSTVEGPNYDSMVKAEQARLLPKEWLDFYTHEYTQRPAPEMRGPLNWYRMTKINFEDEKPLADKGVVQLHLPLLFIGASKDIALPPAMSASMDQTCTNLTRAEVEASHWALVEKPKEVNDSIENWLREKVLKGELKPAL
ncbi:Alpha/Beta hydrolase protein [Stachybotrys elegans]|uniref:Alpha/Beta hydrolase protein n=1 Tax=Stachybotrys elegans TaxID=80388 RepID=A0A8K0WWW5_9HYPO|nr:Alpha/Beta hydrolase protein [Stachybotrys elegans]